MESTDPVPLPQVVLRLFIAGASPRSQAAVARVKALQAQQPQGSDRFRVEIVDVLERPDLADQHGILATPTLVRLEPQPEYRIIGDLSRGDDLLSYLLPDIVSQTS